MAKPNNEEPRSRVRLKRIHSTGLDLTGSEEDRKKRVRAEYDDRQRLTLIYQRMTGKKGDKPIDYQAALREAT